MSVQVAGGGRGGGGLVIILRVNLTGPQGAQIPG